MRDRRPQRDNHPETMGRIRMPQCSEFLVFHSHINRKPKILECRLKGFQPNLLLVSAAEQKSSLVQIDWYILRIQILEEVSLLL